MEVRDVIIMASQSFKNSASEIMQRYKIWRVCSNNFTLNKCLKLLSTDTYDAQNYRGNIGNQTLCIPS